MTLAQKQLQYWRRNLRLTGSLTCIWLLVTFGLSYFAGSAAHIVWFGWPLPFYMAAQGTLIIYVLSVWYYAHAMTALDAHYERESCDGDGEVNDLKVNLNPDDAAASPAGSPGSLSSPR